MSHMERSVIEYQHRCDSILDAVEGTLREAERVVEAILRGSTKLLDGELRAMASDILSAIDGIGRDVHGLRAGRTGSAGDVEKASSLLSSANAVGMRASSLQEAIDRAFDSRMSSKTRDIDSITRGIGEPSVRRMVTLLARNSAHDHLSDEDLVELARCKVDPGRKVRRDLVSEDLAEARVIMADGKVPEENIDRVIGDDGMLSPLEIRDSAVNEVIDESLRRSAIKAIVGSITLRGFIVDRSNIRRDPSTDTVRIVAMKPGGQKAEFNIDLQGRFMYHFQGYEGAACQKDIGPLERDLEQVYGMRLTDRRTISSNPDRLQTRHHMQMKVRRDS